MDIQSFIVPEDMPVYKVASVMNANARPIIFICKNGKLLASLSDGDMRRYIMNKGDASQPVKAIANYHVRSLPIERQIEAVEMLHTYKLKAIPIVNKEDYIVSIKFDDYDEAHLQIARGVPVVIMAGGKGTRLAPYTNILPKPLIPIGEKTITEHIMDRFSAFGCNEFHLIVNYKKDLIKAYFSNVQNRCNAIFHEEQGFLGTGGGLKLLDGIFHSAFFMTNCDVLIYADYEDVLHEHEKKKHLITIVCAKKTITIPYGTVQLGSTNEPVSFEEKPQYSMLVNTGFYVISPEFLLHISEGKTHITDVIQKLMATGCVGVYTISDDAWLDMGEFEQMEKMKERLSAYDEHLR